MSNLAKLAPAGLAIAMIVHAGTVGKASPNPETTSSPPADAQAGFSAWKPVFLMRNGVVNPGKRKDFNDTRFEYRWSEWLANHDGCIVEIRSTGIDENYTVPQIDVWYSDRRSRGHSYTARDVPIGSALAHVTFKPPDCNKVELVFWNK